MGVVVGVLVSDCLDDGTKFTSVVFAGCELDIGQWDDGKLCVVNGNAIGMDACNLGSEKLHVQTYLLMEVKFEGEYGDEKAQDVSLVGTIGSLNGGVDSLWSLYSAMLFRCAVGCE